MIIDVYSSGAGHLCPYGGDVRRHRYRITVSGGLGKTGREAFGDFRIEPNGTNTALIADLDQSGLYGVLNRVQALGLELTELTRLTDDWDLMRRRHLSSRRRVRRLLDVHELQAQRTHAIQQGVQIALVKVTGQDRDGRLHLHQHVGECLARRRAE